MTGRSCPVDEGVAVLKDLTNLRSLNLSNTRITSKATETLGTLTSLDELNINGTDIDDLSGLSPLVQLRVLNARIAGLGDEDLDTVATLAADHRVTDGHGGGRFLAAVDRLLQDSARLESTP